MIEISLTYDTQSCGRTIEKNLRIDDDGNVCTNIDLAKETIQELRHLLDAAEQNLQNRDKK